LAFDAFAATFDTMPLAFSLSAFDLRPLGFFPRSIKSVNGGRAAMIRNHDFPDEEPVLTPVSTLW
jgi:hypothetical protein